MTRTSRVFFLCSLLVVFAALLLAWPSFSADKTPTVVVYTSVDTEYALPIFDKFTKETGIKVVYRTDTEETKTTGLADRLVQMKDHPDGDVFWNSELSFTELLAEKGVLEAYVSPNAKDIPPAFKDEKGMWTGFGCRVRVLVYNTKLVTKEEAEAPRRRIDDLGQPRWKGRFAIAKPLYGTTRSHLVLLWQHCGEEWGSKLFRDWRDNGVVLAESNSDVVARVADGTVDVGLTDSDDALNAMDRHKPVAFGVAGYGGGISRIDRIYIPNTVAVLKNCLHPEQARKFIDFLLRPETEKFLGESGARQIPVRDVGARVPPELADGRGPEGLSCRDGGVLLNLNWVVLPNMERVVVPSNLNAQLIPVGERIYRILRGEEQ
jgi:iron(III) transport system substrate-binding protein